MSSQMIEFAANGHTAAGYLSVPPSGRGPGLVVIQEWWGLVDHIKVVADRFAAEGFVALAPDLYHGEQAKSPDEAMKLMMSLRLDAAAIDIDGAADALRANPAVTTTRVGVIGFCMGGALALHAASLAPERFAAAIDFYGARRDVKPDPTTLTVPLQLHLGSRDKSIPDPAAYIADLKSGGGPVEGYIYDADHAFFNDTRPTAFDAPAAALAWSRSLDFLAKHVR